MVRFLNSRQERYDAEESYLQAIEFFVLLHCIEGERYFAEVFQALEKIWFQAVSKSHCCYLTCLFRL